MKTGSSYLSQSELPLSFGLGQRTMVDKVEIEWPSGAQDVSVASERWPGELRDRRGQGNHPRATLKKDR